MKNTLQELKNELQNKNVSYHELYSCPSPPSETADQLIKARVGGKDVVLEVYENTKEILFFYTGGEGELNYFKGKVKKNENK